MLAWIKHQPSIPLRNDMRSIVRSKFEAEAGIGDRAAHAPHFASRPHRKRGRPLEVFEQRLNPVHPAAQHGARLARVDQFVNGERLGAQVRRAGASQ